MVVVKAVVLVLVRDYLQANLKTDVSKKCNFVILVL